MCSFPILVLELKLRLICSITNVSETGSKLNETKEKTKKSKYVYLLEPLILEVSP